MTLSSWAFVKWKHYWHHSHQRISVIVPLGEMELYGSRHQSSYYPVLRAALCTGFTAHMQCVRAAMCINVLCKCCTVYRLHCAHMRCVRTELCTGCMSTEMRERMPVYLRYIEMILPQAICMAFIFSVSYVYQIFAQ